MRFFFFVCALVSTLTSPVAAQFLCNICGCEGCTYGYSRGVVNFVFQGKAEKVDCLQLQQQVENPTIFGTEFCRTVIWKAAVEPCKCYDPQYPDYLLEEIPDYTEGEYGNNTAARDWHLQNTENGDPGSEGDDGGDGGNNGGNDDNKPDSGSARIGFHCLIAVMAIAFALVC